MTSSTLLSGSRLRTRRHESFVWIDAETHAGVRYRIARMSLGRRIELARQIREAGRRLEFLEAGNDVREKLEAAVLQGEIDRVYLEWGLEAIEGLEIDGEAATPESLDRKGSGEPGGGDPGAHSQRMRVERERKKKLIVAFHFLRADGAIAGWKCEQCRRQGLEARRRCGFLPEAQRGAARVVWARGMGGGGGVSDVSCDAGERGVGGEIFRVEGVCVETAN